MIMQGRGRGSINVREWQYMSHKCPDESIHRAVARTLVGGGGGCIFIYSGSARLTSFEINFISKETSRAEPEYMNIHPPPQLAL